LGRQLGYRGGLKAIEMQMDITRASELQGLNGSDAVYLWNRWRFSQDEEARARLLGYNEADCVNLEVLADEFYSRMVQTLPMPHTMSRDNRIHENGVARGPGTQSPGSIAYGDGTD